MNVINFFGALDQIAESYRQNNGITSKTPGLSLLKGELKAYDQLNENQANAINVFLKNHANRAESFLAILRAVKQNSRNLDVKAKIDAIIGYVSAVARTALNAEMDEKVEKHADYIDFIFSKVQEQEDEIETLKNEMKTQLEQIKDELNKAKEQVANAKNDVTTTVMMVLGVFTAITFALFGGFETAATVAGMFENNAETSRMALAFLALSFLIFNLVFILLYCISKLSGRQITTECPHAKDNGKCCKKERKLGPCKGFRKVLRRYPYIFGINVLLLIGVVVVLLRQPLLAVIFGFFGFH